MRSIPNQRVGETRRSRLGLWASVLALAAGVAECSGQATAQSSSFAAQRSRLVALRKSTGAPLATVSLWRTAAGATDGPVVTPGWAYYVEDRQALCGLNLASGQVAWRSALPAPVRFAPVVCGSMVLVYDEGTLWAFTRTTGRKSWELSLEELDGEWRLSAATQFLLGGNHLVIYSGGQLLTIDARRGLPLWANRNVGLAEGASPVILEDYICIRRAADPSGWARFSLSDGSLAGEEERSGSTSMETQPAARKPAAAPVALSSDRRSLTVTLGSRRWTYKAPAPFAIARVVGETGNTICVQLVAGGPETARAR